jgi:hypothetical protein
MLFFYNQDTPAGLIASFIFLQSGHSFGIGKSAFICDSNPRYLRENKKD